MCIFRCLCVSYIQGGRIFPVVCCYLLSFIVYFNLFVGIFWVFKRGGFLYFQLFFCISYPREERIMYFQLFASILNPIGGRVCVFCVACLYIISKAGRICVFPVVYILSRRVGNCPITVVRARLSQGHLTPYPPYTSHRTNIKTHTVILNSRGESAKGDIPLNGDWIQGGTSIVSTLYPYIC